MRTFKLLSLVLLLNSVPAISQRVLHDNDWNTDEAGPVIVYSLETTSDGRFIIVEKRVESPVFYRNLEKSYNTKIDDSGSRYDYQRMNLPDRGLAEAWRDASSYYVQFIEPDDNLRWRQKFACPFKIHNAVPALSLSGEANIVFTLKSNVTGEEIISSAFDQDGCFLWMRKGYKACVQPKVEDTRNGSVAFKFEPTDRLPYLPGWPIEIPGIFMIMQSAIGADFDPADPQKELVLCLYSGVYAWNHDGTLLPGWPVNPSGNNRGASIIQENGAGKVGFNVMEGPGRAFIYHHSGMIEPGWPVNTGDQGSDSPIRENMDGDPQYEVVNGTGGIPSNFYIWDSNGSTLPPWPLTLSQNVTGMAVGDVNNDSLLEIVVTSTSLANKRVWVLSANAQILYQWTPQVIELSVSEDCPALADLDSDGDLEILLPVNMQLICYHHNGSVYWSISLQPPEFYVSQVAIGDLEGDGSLEIGFTTDSYLYLLNSDGTLHPGHWPIFLPHGSWGLDGGEHPGPSIGDVDGDGEQEMVLNGLIDLQTGQRWFLIAFNDDGSIVQGFPSPEPPGDYEVQGTPVIFDMDNDGDVEIACYACAGFFPTSVFRIVVYDLPSLYNPLLMDWPVIQHDARRTGCYSAPTFSRNGVVDGSANRAPLAELVGFMLSSPCPNPFNSETEFTLVLTQGMEVSLIIYDIQGREIAALIDGWREAGTHRITFNGAELASGLYFAHFKAGNYEKTEKMMFLK